jgi:dipeptidyl-peptidase 4
VGKGVAGGNGPGARSTFRDQPLQLGQTQRFTLGVPRQFTIAADGSGVLFIRSLDGRNQSSCLWVLDQGGERCLADPEALGGEGPLPEAERLHRQRVRERSTGIVAYSADRNATTAVFSLGSSLWAATIDGEVRQLPCVGAPVDPQIDPGGDRVAYVSDGALHVLVLSDGTDRVLAVPEAPEVTYGLAEYVAEEEMDRRRGHWWSPTGSMLLAARVDNRPMCHWWIAEPSEPWAKPRQICYPRGGTTNAEVSLWILGIDGSRVEVRWDRQAFEYLATASWDAQGPLISVQSRDQKTVRTLGIDPASGETTLLWEETDACWVDLVPGTPTRTESGRLVVVSNKDDARRLVVGGAVVTGRDLQVREVLGIADETVWFTASTDPTERHVWTYTGGRGTARLTEDPGLHHASVRGETAVIESFTERGRQAEVSGPALGDISVSSLEETPFLAPNVQWLSVGPRALRTALILPNGHEPGSGPLPVLMCPYGGPGVQLVTRGRHWYFAEAQWFAEQGFAVVIADGAGTPGRGPAWEREIYGDVLTAVIADQVAALEGAAGHCRDLDLGRVAIRGWSFGGLLAYACVVRRPDVFHAAVAGAAPVDFVRLSGDTQWLERYLGHPEEHPENYRRCSPVYEATELTRPLLIINGTADDIVVVADALQLSAALLAADRQHELVLLPKATHMVIDPDVTADLLVHELRFIRRSLAALAAAGGETRA